MARNTTSSALLTLSGPPALSGPLTEAVKVRDVAQVSNLLAAGDDVHERVQRDYPINVAASFGPAEMVSVLLKAGARIEQPGRDGLRPLHNAVISGHADIVALLIRKGAEVNAKDKKDRSPLIYFAAFDLKDLEIARTLLAAGADPKIVDEGRETAFNFSAYSGNIELGKLLMAAGADISHRAGTGEFPVHAASFHGRHAFMKLLIAAGADVNLKTTAGNTALFYAQDDEMRKLLTDAGAK